YWVWTVNQEEDIQKFKEWGVDGVITDHPREALAIMDA
ncbi:glycerophosphodiester phosphodiesterase family protein, partial [Dubosiella newyorkensis]